MESGGPRGETGSGQGALAAGQFAKPVVESGGPRREAWSGQGTLAAGRGRHAAVRRQPDHLDRLFPPAEMAGRAAGEDASLACRRPCKRCTCDRTPRDAAGRGGRTCMERRPRHVRMARVFCLAGGQQRQHCAGPGGVLTRRGQRHLQPRVRIPPGHAKLEEPLVNGVPADPVPAIASGTGTAGPFHLLPLRGHHEAQDPGLQQSLRVVPVMPVLLCGHAPCGPQPDQLRPRPECRERRPGRAPGYPAHWPAGNESLRAPRTGEPQRAVAPCVCRHRRPFAAEYAALARLLRMPSCASVKPWLETRFWPASRRGPSHATGHAL